MDDKKEYEEPIIEIIYLSSCDIIQTSNPQSGGLDNSNIDWGNINWF